MERTNGAPVASDRKIAWIDVETTSLSGEDPRVLLLEVAVLLTDVQLRELDREAVVIAWSPEELEAARWDRIARDMHEANGLLAEVGSSCAVPLAHAEARLLRLLERNGIDLSRPADTPGQGSESEHAPLWGGFSPWLDRTVIRRCMVGLYERLHFRSLDVTSLKLATEFWLGAEWAKSGPREHRALADVCAAVERAGRVRHLVSSGASLAVSFR